MPRQSLNRAVHGVIFLDVLAAVFVLALGAAAFFSLYPVVSRSERIAREHTEAAQLAAKMAEHLQLLKPSDLKESTLLGLHLIDEEQDGQPFSFSHIPMDEASQYSPSTMLKQGEGWLTITDLEAGSKKAVITINWVDPTGRPQTFVTGTILGGYR